MTHSTHFILRLYGGNFILQLYGVKRMVNDHSDSKRGKTLPPHHGLFFPVSNKGSFISAIPQTGKHILVKLVVEHWLE